jgi:hypothetical protein
MVNPESMLTCLNRTHTHAPVQSITRARVEYHIGCRVDGEVHVAKLASYIQTWAQLEQVVDMCKTKLPFGFRCV